MRTRLTIAVLALVAASTACTGPAPAAAPSVALSPVPAAYDAAEVPKRVFPHRATRSRPSPAGPTRAVLKVSRTSPRPQVSAQVGTTVWDRLAQCESTSRWHLNTGNGFYGGLQFDYGTWLAYGGGAYAKRADLASREAQITVAKRLHADKGFAPWPGCKAKLGL